jgi:hypothetical protein
VGEGLHWVNTTNSRKSIMPIVFAKPVSPASPFLLQDTFTDVDGTQITSHTMDVGPGWSISGMGLQSAGTADKYDIFDNRLRLKQDDTCIVSEAGVSDGTIEVQWTPQVAVDDRNSIVFRYVDADNHWLFNLRGPQDDIRLLITNGTSVLLKDSLSFSWVDGQTYNIKVVLAGNTKQCYIDDVLKFTNVESNYSTATKHGLGRNFGSEGSEFDNFTMLA